MAVNQLNYIRVMGEVALTSLTDAVRPAMVHGLRPYMETIGKLATNVSAIKMSVNEAQLAGQISERVLGQRLATLSDIADPYAARGPVEAFINNMSNVASRWNGIRMWTDMMKSVASVMTQNRILGNIDSFANLEGGERAYMHYLGIDANMASRIGQQFSEHGDTLDSVRVANTEEWTDRVAVRAYRAAINKDVDSIIVDRGVADVPLFANTSTGKMIFQFKSFALASHQRVLLRGLQEDQTRFLSGLIAMTAAGMMVTYLKALLGNRDEKLADFQTNPGWWIAEGIDRSGVLAVPMELANAFEKASTVNPIKSPVRAFDDDTRLSQRVQNRSIVGALAGPTAGLVDDAATTMGIPAQLAQGEDLTKGQRGAAERLLPFNSYYGVRQLMRYVVNAD